MQNVHIFLLKKNGETRVYSLYFFNGHAKAL